MALKFKRPAKKTVWLIAIGLAAAALAYFYFSLPKITANFLVSQAEKFGLKNLSFKVVHVGFQRLGLKGITAGDATDPALSIRDLSIEYSLAGLWQKKIKNVRLAGARIKLENRGRGFHFPGMITPPVAQEQNGAMPTVERLILEDSSLRLVWEGRSLEIPISATLRASGPGYFFSALLRPLSETVRLQGTVDKNLTTGKIAFAIPGFPLQALIDQAGFGTSARGKGRIAAQGEIIMQDGGLKTAAVSAASLGDLQLAVPDQGSVILDSFSLAFTLGTGFSVRNIIADARGRQLHVGETAAEAPFALGIRGRQWPELEFAIRDVKVIRPLPIMIGQITGKFTGPWSTARISGDFGIQAGAGMLAALGLPGEITHPYAMAGKFQGSLLAGNIAWTMQTGGKGGLAVALGRDSLQGRLNLNIALKGDARRLRASVNCRMPAIEMQLAGYGARADIFSANAELDYIFGGNFRGRGLVNVKGGNIAASASNVLAAAGINLEIPWHWPGSGSDEKGGFAAAWVQSNGMRWQNISGTLLQQDAALRFSGSMHGALAKIILTFQGRYAPTTAGGSLQADFVIPPLTLPAKTALQPLHPLLQGMSGSGLFQAEGRIWIENDSTAGSAVIKIANGDFNQQKEKIALRGVNAEIRLVNLFDFISAPAQRIDFRELQWQDMLFSNGEIIFSNESGGTFFVESGRFDWCQGKISIAPFRINPGATDFLMTINCDRVNFAQMINTLVGKTIVSGDALMSGIVPIQMVKGNPVFLDGYLYSTPGRSGNLKVAKPELISNGQVLVEEAIRDFRYNWIKVKIGSRDDLLDLVVSMDGAPARKLPLQYDQKQKNFIKDPSGGRHVELKGLLLDIRFIDIDLKDLLKASSQMTSSHQIK